MGMLDDVKSKKKQKAAENWTKMADSAKTTEKQIEYYTKSLDVDPYNAEAWFKKGKALEKVGRFEEAKKSFDLAIEIDPDYQGLIGGSHGSSAEMSNAHFMEEDAYEPETAEPVIEEEMMEEESISEPEIIHTEPEEISDESISSYSPPVGDESVFSNVVSGENTDNVSPSDSNHDSVEEQEVREEFVEDIAAEPELTSDFGPESVSESQAEPETISEQDSGYESRGEPEENVFGSSPVPQPEPTEHDVISGSPPVDKNDESVFSSPSSPVAQEPVSSYTAEENVIGRKGAETIRSAPVSAPSSTPVAASVPPVSDSPKRQAAGYESSSGSIAGSKPIAISGADLVDIRIPLNETIKFWAIGIVAMLIVLILSKVL
ncbi:tetratricopeptide repeat protein [uncultured Methanolobus sp.]|uniref:tetratricopeptide repeat protein n=1 Tax=uncultured Methanolobus sp. TaxID=218300 RepID=UPI002AAAA973|nr:tetratricopeptide repeat protein [uncultured Methanolobus sp.]